MKFRDWLLSEAGHISFSPERNFTVLRDSKPVFCKDVIKVDPRFEFYDDQPNGQFYHLPPSQGSRAKKFLGEAPFSLPLISPQGGHVIGYLASTKRSSMMDGNGVFVKNPIGVVAPINWADKALVIDTSYEDVFSKMDQQKAIA